MLTLRDFYSQQFQPDVLPNLKLSTQSSYRANMNHHALPALGDMRLVGLSRSDAQRFVTALAGKGPRTEDHQERVISLPTCVTRLRRGTEWTSFC